MKKRVFKPEIGLALEAMAKGKAPGPNGIIVEFFLSMWLVIGREYTKMIHDAILNDYFPHNFTRGLITLCITEGRENIFPIGGPLHYSMSHTKFCKGVVDANAASANASY
jgi:hypothetical protein